MDKTTTNLTTDEVLKIDEHKYFLSEKAGYDVGWEHAEQDWKEKYSDQVNLSEANTNSEKRTGLGGFLKRLLSRAAV